eukprot:scaffold4510_cov183-Amphora_coffeaeformis.AAC.50
MRCRIVLEGNIHPSGGWGCLYERINPTEQVFQTEEYQEGQPRVQTSKDRLSLDFLLLALRKDDGAGAMVISAPPDGNHHWVSRRYIDFCKIYSKNYLNVARQLADG